jgi:hypothetical protein
MLLFPPGTVHKMADIVFSVDNIKVYKQAKGFTTQLRVRKELGLRDRAERVCRFWQEKPLTTGDAKAQRMKSV